MGSFITKDWEAWEDEIEVTAQLNAEAEVAAVMDRHEAAWSDLSIGESITLLAVGLGSVAFMALAIVGGIVMWRSLT